MTSDSTLQQRAANDSGLADLSTPTESPQSLEAFVASSRARKERNERRQTEGYIYFVQCGEFVKIGYTANPTSRMSKFKTNNPYECRLVALIDGGKIVEAQMHERFAEFRHRGEWYRCGESLMAFIASLSEQPAVSV